MEKKTFLFYTSWKKNVDMMDDNELRRFINNLINYSEGKEVDLPSRLEKMIWNDVVELLNFNEVKRQRTIERRREAGQKGGAPSGNKNAQKKTEIEETTKTTKNNQLVEKQTKQTDIGRGKKEEGYMLKEEGNMKKEEGNMKKVEGNMVYDIGNKLIDIMKQVIEDGYVDEEEVKNWKINDTRELITDILLDYPNWESDLLKLGLDSFMRKLPTNTKVEIDYVIYSTLKAHLAL